MYQREKKNKKKNMSASNEEFLIFLPQLNFDENADRKYFQWKLSSNNK